MTRANFFSYLWRSVAGLFWLAAGVATTLILFIAEPTPLILAFVAGGCFAAVWWVWTP